MWINYLETWPDWDNMSCYYNVTLCLLTAILYFSNEFWSLMLQNKLKWNINHHSRALKSAISVCGISVKGLMIPYFIEYNAHTSIMGTWISQMIFWQKNYFYFSRIISQKLIIASLFGGEETRISGDSYKRRFV